MLNTWRYEFCPRAEGTDVTESFGLSGTLAIRLYWKLAGWARRRHQRERHARHPGKD
jgi:hypothetical protein